MATPPDAKVPRIPELVGAVSEFQLTGAPVTVLTIPLQEPSGPASEMAEGLADWAPRRIFLNMEKMLAEQGAPPYSVYVNVPPGDNPEAYPELLAGELPMFGLREASITDERHRPTGLYTQVELTRVYNYLLLIKKWDPKSLRLTLVPKYPGPFPPIQVGRISLYYA